MVKKEIRKEQEEPGERTCGQCWKAACFRKINDKRKGKKSGLPQNDCLKQCWDWKQYNHKGSNCAPENESAFEN